jgi:hypothetical protein
MSNLDKAIKLIEEGAPIAGAAVGAALGVMTSGPLMAASGGAAGAVMGKIVEDAAHRLLSRRERVRVGATAWYALDFTRARLQAGEKIREDGFFEKREFGSTPAEEIFDGVLVKARKDHEERKARFYGKFFSNLAFDTTCSRDAANYFLYLLDRLTYSQLAIIALFSHPKNFALSDQANEFKKVNNALEQTLLATFELIQSGLLKLWYKDTRPEVVVDMAEIRASDVKLSRSGARLYALAGLDLIPQKEREDMAAIFNSADRAGGVEMEERSKLLNR